MDDSTVVSSSASQSTFQQLQPFLHYLFNTYSQPEYARFLRYPHALYFLESLLVYDDDNHENRKSNLTEDSATNVTTAESTSSNTDSSGSSNTGSTSTGTNKLWVEWTVPSYRNFCHQQQFLAWQYRHSTCYGVGGVSSTNTNHNDSNQCTTTTLNENDDMDDDDDDKQE